MNWDTELMQPKRQSVWGFPAVANFILGGTGAGFYLLFSVYELQAGPLPGPQSGGAEILSPLLVCLGFLALTLEVGRPFRGVYLLSNLRRSWVSIEVLAGALFISFSIFNWLSPSPILHISASCAAIVFAVSQGFIVYRARAINAWNVPVIPFLFFSSALVMGGGLLLIVGGLQRSMIEGYAFMTIMISLMANIAAWGLYVWVPWDIQFLKITIFLRRPLSIFFVMGLGQILPFVMMGLTMLAEESMSAVAGYSVAVMAGLFILAGGASQKAVLIFGANSLRGVRMGVARENDLTKYEDIHSSVTGNVTERHNISAGSVKN